MLYTIKHGVLTFVQVNRSLDNTAVMIALTRTRSDRGREVDTGKAMAFLKVVMRKKLQ